MVAGWIHIGGMSVGGEFELGVEDANHDMQREQWPSRDLARSIVGRGREGSGGGEPRGRREASAGKRGLGLPALCLRCLRLPVSSPDTHPVFTGPGFLFSIFLISLTIAMASTTATPPASPRQPGTQRLKTGSRTSYGSPSQIPACTISLGS